MSSPEPDNSSSVEIDAICRRFETAWGSGSAPRIEDFQVPLPGDSDNILLFELVKLDLKHREKHGETATLNEYAKRFPDHAAWIQSKLVDLLQSKVQAPQLSATVLEPRAKPTAEVSRRVGPYKLLQLIGEGGMGAVYMADQVEPVKRRVALKLIKSGMDSKQVVARFEAERQALAMMDHQNIAKVLDAGISDDGTPYFAMELVQGMPITKYCDREKLSIPDRLKLFVQVCRALQHAHQKGVIHRDIKPTNVLVTQRDGVPVAKVIDFGLAKAMQNELRLTVKTLFTEVGQVCGTLEYMSPEQAEMNELGLDTRTDVYSLGVLLYELLTGSTPLGHDRIRKEAFHRVLELILKEEPPRPSRRLSDSGDAITGISEQRRIEPRHLSGILKRELDWIALKALEKDRNRRYDGAGKLGDDVQHYLGGDVVSARPPSTGYRLRKAIRKHKAAFVSGAAIVLLLLAGVIGTGMMWLQASNAEAQARVEAENARAAKNLAQLEAERASKAEGEMKLTLSDLQAQRRTTIEEARKASEQLYLNQIASAQREWEIENVAAAFDHLNACQLEMRGWEHDYLYAQFTRGRSELLGHGGAVNSVAFSPDGSLIVSCDDKTVRVWDADTCEEIRKLMGHVGNVNSAVFSLDGTKIVSVSEGDFQRGINGEPDTGSVLGELKVWEAATGRQVLTLELDSSSSCAAFHPDGSQIATMSDFSDTITVRDAHSGVATATLKSESAGFIKTVAFDTTGDLVFGGTEEGALILWDLKTGMQQKRNLKGQTGAIASIGFTTDGRRIVTGGSIHDDNSNSFSYESKVWDAINGELVLKLEGHRGSIRSVAFSRDGFRIATGSDDNTLRVWDSIGGKLELTLIGHTGPVLTTAFNPDGTKIASGSSDGTIKVWDAVSGQKIPTIKGVRRAGIESVDFSPDGKQIVSGCDDPTVQLWDSETYQEMLAFNGHLAHVTCVRFNSDGQRIVSADNAGEIIVWDTEKGTEIRKFKHEYKRGNHHIDQFIAGIAINSDGSRIVEGGRVYDWSDDKMLPALRVWDAATNNEVLTFTGHEHSVDSVDFSPDGKQIVSGGGDNTVRIWNAENGEAVLTLSGHADKVQSVEFSPDGKRVVSGSRDQTLKVWDTETGHALLTLSGHRGRVASVSFSPDGMRIASGSDDNTVKVWNAGTGRETLTLKGHTRVVSSVGFSRDGKRIVSGSSDGTLKVWDARPSTAEQLAARRIVAIMWQADNVLQRAWQSEFTRASVSESIRTNQTITEDVRRKALELVEVIEGPSADTLNMDAWEIVRQSDLAHEKYVRAVRQSQAAVDAEPENGYFLNTLGIAQYRIADYEAALETLTRSEQLNSKSFDGASPADLVFLAMTNQQLGNNAQAMEQLRQVLRLSQEPARSQNSELNDFLNEAKALIEHDLPPGIDATK